MTKDEMKDKISIALKNDVLQQGFEIIYKNLAELEKENAELKEKISILLSCKNCPENKGGWICAKEYENKCLAQKIEFIKELEKEKCELLGIIQGKDKEIIKRTVVENFCCNDCKEIGLFLECQKKKKSCETIVSDWFDEVMEQ